MPGQHCQRGSPDSPGLTARKFPDPKRVLAQNQFAVLLRVEIQRLVYELEFFVEGEFPSRLRIAGAPDQSLAAELFINGFEKRVRVAIRELFHPRKFVRLGGADPDLR